MTYANSSETEVAFVEEVTWGVTPTTPGFQRFRMTSESLTYEIEYVRSDEITPTADIVDEVQVGASATGDLNFELTFGDNDTGVMLAHALRANWVAGTAADDLEDLVAGTLKKSMTIEKRFALEAGSTYARSEGLRANTLALAVDEGGLVTGTVGFIGKGESGGTTAIAGATYNPPNAGRPMAAPNVANIAVGGIGGAIFYSSLNFNLNNNCEAQGALGSIDAVGVRYGRREIEGTMTVYLNSVSDALYSRFVDGTRGSLGFDFADAAGDTYSILMPNVGFVAGARNAGGNNEDVTIELSFTAFLDATLGSSIRIQRTAAGS